MDLKNRLHTLNQRPALPAAEIDALGVVYERLVSAKAVCRSAFGEDVSHEVVAAVAAEIGAEVWRLIANDRFLIKDVDPS